MVAVPDLGRMPLEEEGVANRQQRRAQKDADKAKGENSSEEAEEGEHLGKAIGPNEEIGPAPLAVIGHCKPTPGRQRSPPLAARSPSGRALLSTTFPGPVFAVVARSASAPIAICQFVAGDRDRAESARQSASNRRGDPRSGRPGNRGQQHIVRRWIETGRAI